MIWVRSRDIIVQKASWMKREMVVEMEERFGWPKGPEGEMWARTSVILEREVQQQIFDLCGFTASKVRPEETENRSP